MTTTTARRERLRQRADELRTELRNVELEVVQADRILFARLAQELLVRLAKIVEAPPADLLGELVKMTLEEPRACFSVDAHHKISLLVPVSSGVHKRYSGASLAEVVDALRQDAARSLEKSLDSGVLA